MSRPIEDEALDERLSAAIDGELDSAAEREALEARVAADPALAARRAAFASVDDGLRALAADRAAASDPASVEQGWQALRARIAEGGRAGAADAGVEGEVDAAPGDGVTPIGAAGTRGFGPALFWAAAAALAIWLLVPGAGSPPDAPSSPDEGGRLAIEDGAPGALGAPGAPSASGDTAAPASGVGVGVDEAVDPAPLMALGYGEEGDDGFFVPGVPIEDLPVIEELDLLDYLKARERAERGGRG